MNITPSSRLLREPVSQVCTAPTRPRVPYPHTALPIPCAALVSLVQRGHLPRGVLLSQSDVRLIKAFDRDGDGVLTPDEMELAQAAFRAQG